MAESITKVLAAAQQELRVFARYVEGTLKAPDSRLQFFSATHKKLADKIQEVIDAVRKRPTWQKVEADTWRATYEGLELNIWRDAGTYYWTVGSTWTTHGKSLEDAKESVERLLGQAE